jgi:hypothetical protein
MSRPVLYSPEEATKLLPRFAALLPELRKMREDLIETQNKCDVEEIASFGTAGPSAQESRDKMDGYHAHLRSLERAFEKKIRVFEELGCELKGLEPGLIDFYSEKDGELIYLCWREGEEAVAHWHPLSTGYAGREPLA